MNKIIEELTNTFAGGLFIGAVGAIALLYLFFNGVLFAAYYYDQKNDIINQKDTHDKLHCFQCEAVTPIKQLANNGLCCSDCGLRHR